MRKITLSIIAITISLFSFGQGVDGTELGIDASFYATTGQVSSGTFGIGAKYGLKFGENIILGPSFRYQRAWTNNKIQGTKGGFNIFGGGAFIHGRFNNVLFAGIEAEILRSPYTNNGFLTTNPKWVGTCLIGAGFSREFENELRLNAGVYYDILDIPNPSNPDNPNPNSPLQPYLSKNSQGTVIPILYRIALFIPLT